MSEVKCDRADAESMSAELAEGLARMYSDAPVQAVAEAAFKDGWEQGWEACRETLAAMVRSECNVPGGGAAQAWKQQEAKIQEMAELDVDDLEVEKVDAGVLQAIAKTVAWLQEDVDGPE
jgi:hypothetical protein